MNGFESPRARAERMRRERYAVFNYLVDTVPADGDRLTGAMGAFFLFCELQPEAERIEREPVERVETPPRPSHPRGRMV